MVTNLNRIGIFLSFLAGFMLAPELIGLDRIRKLEAWIEGRLAAGRQMIDNVSQKLSRFGTIRKNLRHALSFVPAIIIFGSFLLAMGKDFFLKSYTLFFNFSTRTSGEWVFAILFVLFCLFMGITGFYAGIGFHDRRLVISSFLWLLGALLSFANPLFALLLVMLAFLVPTVSIALGVMFIVVIIFSLNTVNKTIRRMLAAFEANDRLQGYIVTSGIALYIAGNVCQLIATF